MLKTCWYTEGQVPASCLQLLQVPWQNQSCLIKSWMQNMLYLDEGETVVLLSVVLHVLRV